MLAQGGGIAPEEADEIMRLDARMNGNSAAVGASSSSASSDIQPAVPGSSGTTTPSSSTPPMESEAERKVRSRLEQLASLLHSSGVSKTNRLGASPDHPGIVEFAGSDESSVLPRTHSIQVPISTAWQSNSSGVDQSSLRPGAVSSSSGEMAQADDALEQVPQSYRSAVASSANVFVPEV